jgi:hypothetical protein
VDTDHQEPNWAEIEAAYTAGTDSLRGLSRRFQVPLTTLRRRIQRYGWVRQSAARLNILRERLAQQEAHGSARASPAEIAERLAEEAAQDASDLGMALMTARTILRRLREVAETELTPTGLRTIAEAVHRATETIFRIRRLDQPAEETVVIERAYTPAEAPEPADHAPTASF